MRGHLTFCTTLPPQVLTGHHLGKILKFAAGVHQQGLSASSEERRGTLRNRAAPKRPRVTTSRTTYLLNGILALVRGERGHYSMRHDPNPGDVVRIPYTEYLKSPYWKAIRRRVLIRDGRQCLACGSSEHLNVHHMDYSNLGHEDEDALMTLCESCHCGEHRLPAPPPRPGPELLGDIMRRMARTAA